MKAAQHLLDKIIAIEISGTEKQSGKLLDVAQDLVVIFNGEDYVYIPANHIQHLWLNETNDENEQDYQQSGTKPFEDGSLSLRSVLNNAKGLFSEIKVVGSQSIHGYITSVQSDYIVFYSPVFKTMFLPIHHIKWLIPYQNSQTPYALTKERLPVNPSNISNARSFEVQLQKLIGKLVVMDLGTVEKRIGQLRKVDSNMIELVMAKEDVVLINLRHIKSVHFE